jgi:hypothetical protein
MSVQVVSGAGGAEVVAVLVVGAVLVVAGVVGGALVGGRLAGVLETGADGVGTGRVCVAGGVTTAGACSP